MKNRKIGGLLIGSLILVGLVLLFNSYNNLSRHIMPGPSMAPSSSLKPYEINLRTARPIHWDREEKEENIYEWKLSVPRAYVFDEVGSNGAVNEYKGAKNNSYFPKLRWELDPDMKTLTPFPPGQRKYGPQHMAIFLRNSRTSLWEAKHNTCVPSHLNADVAKQYGADGYSIECRTGSKLCGIAMQIDGWFVEASVTKVLYAQPELVCKITKDFLQKYTVKRDNILYKIEGNE